jgi:hypothetical protein
MLLAPKGTVNVTLTAGESIAVLSQGYADVSRVIGFPNYPDQIQYLGSVNNSQVVFGPYASGATIVIEASGGVPVQYETGTAPTVKQIGRSAGQGVTVSTVNATATLTPANLIGRMITSTTAAAVTGTLPTGAILEAASDFDTSNEINWTVQNLGATNAFTVAAAASGHTVSGNMTVAASSSGSFSTVRTGASTFVTYRT